MSHASELRSICKLVESLGGVANVIGQRAMPNRKGRWYVPQTSGMPDLYVQMDTARANQKVPRAVGYEAYSFWYEVKIPPDVLRPAQHEFIARENANGIPVPHGDRDHFIVYLRQLGYEIQG